jgi:hypothetical protein
MEIHIGRKLLPSEHVHHKNHIRDDNRLENLEILTNRDHGFRHARPSETITTICPECGEPCVTLLRMYKHNQINNKRGPFCGRQCSGKYTRRIQIANGINVLPKF